MLRKFQLSFQDDVLLFLDRLVVEEVRLVVLFRDGVGVFVQRGGLKLLLRRLRVVVLLIRLGGGREYLFGVGGLRGWGGLDLLFC